MSYSPRSGDIIWIDLDPQKGYEQKGRRPVLVVWNNDTLEHVRGLAQVCVISNTDNGFPLHVPLSTHCSTTSGFVFCEQTKVLDLEACNAEYKDHVSENLLEKVRNILKAMID